MMKIISIIQDKKHRGFDQKKPQRNYFFFIFKKGSFCNNSKFYSTKKKLKVIQPVIKRPQQTIRKSTEFLNILIDQNKKQ